MNQQRQLFNSLGMLLAALAFPGEAIARPALCPNLSGTYRNHRGDLVYLGRLQPSNEPANFTSLELILPSESPRPLISTGFYIPNGYGTPTLKRPEYTLAFIELQGWRVAVFHEGPLLWYDAPRRISRENSLWFQVLCDRHDGAAAARVPLPVLNVGK
jgi:hypothetical protein